MTRRNILPMALVLLISAIPSVAKAQDAAACKDGYDRSQVSRDAGKLIEAKKLLQQCARATCSAFVQKECVGWLEDVEARLASVVLSAKDGAGTDLLDVAVSVDGKEGPRQLDGRALDIDPGAHTFVFQLADGKKVEQRIVLREREKGRSVAVTFGAPPASSANGNPLAPPEEPAASDAHGTSSLKWAGLAVAGVGVAGLVVGTVFGLRASSKLAAPQCDTSAKVCDPGVLGDVKSAGTVSTIGFIAGGVLVAAGVTLVIVAPRPSGGKSSSSTSARLRATPLVERSAGGLSLVGAW